MAASVALAVACSAAPPSPSPSPSVATFVVAATIAKKCPNANGCAYEISVQGSRVSSRADIVVSGTSGSAAAGLPDSLDPGDYEVGVTIYALPARTSEASCGSDLTVKPGTATVSARVAVSGDACGVTFVTTPR